MSRFGGGATGLGEAEERGVTLIEMAVVLLIMSVVVVLITGLLISVQRDQSTIDSRDAADGQAQVMSESVSHLLRAAIAPPGSATGTTPFVLAAASQLEFYSSLGYQISGTTYPSQVYLHTIPSCTGCTNYELVEDVVQPTLTAGVLSYTGSAARTILGSGMVLPGPSIASDCSSASGFVPGLFEYFQTPSSPATEGPCVSIDTADYPPAQYQVNPSAYSQIENITVTLSTENPSRPSAASLITTTVQVSLLNVDFSNNAL